MKKVKNITFISGIPTDIYKDFSDVLVTLEDNSQYWLEFATPETFVSYMDRKKRRFVKPVYPCIIVQKLTGAVIDSFQSDSFRTLIAIPRIEYQICPKQKYLIANVWMVNELFYYNYPFYFPNFFNTKLTKDQFEVRFKFIQVFSSINIEKVFWVQEFISSKVSNQ